MTPRGRRGQAETGGGSPPSSPPPPAPSAPIILTPSKTTTEAETRAGIRWIAQRDLYALAKVLCGYQDLSRTFHLPLCERVQATREPFNMYLLSRGHFKTSLLTVARNVQRILQPPATWPQGSPRILIASNKGENANSMLYAIQGHLTDPKLVWAFPDILEADPGRYERWTRDAIIVKRPKRMMGVTVQTIGAEGELTSQHYDHATFDDLVGNENSQTKEQLVKTIRWWRTAQSLLDPHATQDIIGTPWAWGDLYHAILQDWRAGKIRLNTYRQPCFALNDPGALRLDNRGNVLPDEYAQGCELPRRGAGEHAGGPVPAFAERFSLRKLADTKAVLDAPEWAAQWLLNPTDDETAVFPRRQARIITRDRCPDPASLWCCMTIDPAQSERSWADYTAIAVSGFDSAGNWYVLDLRRGRWDEDKVVEEVYDAYAKTPGIRALGFEAVGFAKLYRREFQRAGETRGYLPITTLERDTKIAKRMRIRGLQPFWNRGELFLLADLPALDDFLEEAATFRLYREAPHDDMLDALVDALQLRVRPAEVEPDYLIEDAEVRARFEHARMARQKTPGMDDGSLRMAYLQSVRLAQFDEERAQIAQGSSMADFVA